MVTQEVSAWIQYQHFGNRLMKTVLRLRENEDPVDLERSRLESLFTDRISDFHEDIVPLMDRNLEQISSLPVNDWMESPDDYYNEWDDVGPCFGDECDQCEIPADYKQESVHIDVLEFLGISRAEPLRAQKRL
jgi:hypothetical protein